MRIQLTFLLLWMHFFVSSQPQLVRDILPGSGSSTSISSTPLLSTGNYLFFMASDSTHGQELWRSDGTESGTILLKDVYAGTGSGAYRMCIAHNSYLYFISYEGAYPPKLWRSDGTPDGTARCVNPTSGSGGFYNFGSAQSPNFIIYNNKIYCGHFGEQGPGVYQIMDNGTMNLIRGGYISPAPEHFKIWNGKMYFSGSDNNTHAEPWVSDGTLSGTKLIKDIFLSGSFVDPWGNSSPNCFVPTGPTLFFTAKRADTGRELWKTDGTEGGTVLIKDIFPGTMSGASNYPQFSTALNDNLLFLANMNTTNSCELWASDGTSAGTQVLKSIGANFNLALGLLGQLGNRQFFTASGSNGATELWSTDGTSAGTALVKSIQPFVNSSYPNQIVYGNEMYFSASDSTNGQELWKTDGTPDGTVLVADINPGAGNSIPSRFVMVGSTLYFFTGTTETGRELWKMELPPLPAIEPGSSASLYPNPASDQLYVKSPPGKTDFTLFNTLGQTIQSGTFVAMPDMATKIDLEHSLDFGTYYLVIQQENYKQVHPVVIKRK